MSKIDQQLNFSPLCRRCHKPVLATQAYTLFAHNEIEHTDCDNPQARSIPEKVVILNPSSH